MGGGLVKLILRVVGHRSISFDGSRIYYWGVPMVLLPMKSFGFLQEQLKSSFGEISDLYLYHLGKIQGKNGTNILLKKYNFSPREKDLNFFLDQTKFVGIGGFDIIENGLKKGCTARIFNSTSPFAREYKQIFGIQKEGCCHYIRGLLAGATQTVCESLNGVDVELVCNEVKCISKGDDVCEFEIRPKKKGEICNQDFKEIPIEIKDIRKIETLKKLLRVPVSNTSESRTELYSLLKRHNKNFFIFSEEGEVSIYRDVKGLVTPLDILNLIYYLYSSAFDNEEVEKIFYETGRFAGLTESKKFMKEYNVSKKRDTIKLLIEQIGVFGLGKAKLLSLDSKNNAKVEVRNSPGLLFKNLKGVQKKKFDYLVGGFLSGVFSFFYGGDFVVVERECSAMKNSPCIFEIKRV